MNEPVTAVEVCHECGCIVDPESHAVNAKTGERYCSAECWAEGVIA